MDKEVRIDAYRRAVNEYLNNENVYEFKVVGDNYPKVVISDANKALEFVKLHLDKDLYDRFYSKVYPLEETKYNKNTDEKKLEIAKIATLVANKRKCILSVLEELEFSPEKYIYLVKQLAIKYRVINMTTFIENRRYSERVMRTIYSENNNRIKGFNDVENEIAYDVLDKFNLRPNSETLSEVYKYIVEHNLISRLSTNKKR